MSTIKNMLDDCMRRVVEETEIEEFLIMAFNNTDEVFLTDAVVFIINSLILERVSEYERSELLSKYGEIGYMASKGEIIEERKKIKRKFLEENLTTGIANFFDAFTLEFNPEKHFLPRIRKRFKNYKFKKINIVNDYAILFFAFKLIDEIHATETNPDDLAMFSDYLADMCFEELHNPYNKKAKTVDCESLLRFFKRFFESDYAKAYVRMMVLFVQGIEDSVSLPAHIKYDFYERFCKHIEVINLGAFLAQKAKKIETVFDGTQTDTKKISKFIYNMIQKVKKSDGSEDIEIALKELQKNMLWLQRNAAQIDKISKKGLYKRCSLIYDSIMRLKDLSNGQFEFVCPEIMQQYQSLSFELEGENLGVLDFLLFILMEEGVAGLKFLLKKKGYEKNPLLVLLFSVAEIKNIKEFQSEYLKIIGEVRKIVNSTVPVLSQAEYSRVTTGINFNWIDIPIFNNDADDRCFEIATKVISG